MKNVSSQRGSALLIVLGMLAFMVVSAVAFSAYMRSSRLPSSYLRRTVASRLLAKAALAEAMERLDIAIGDNPYPGVGNQTLGGEIGDSRREAVGIDVSDTVARNYFYHNIFIGTNGWLDAENTVSVLNLEALAYVPMSLINEARRYSRMSPAATWHGLRFDAGRYAYAAIDVSDFFDVNRLSANVPRDSLANRISLAYLFETDHDTHANVDADKWDQFVDRCFNDSNDMPFMSIADLNLAMGDTANQSPINSPFCRYLRSGTEQTFYQNDTEAQRLKQFNFVTDSYFPHVDIGEVQDLASEDGQPFSEIVENGALNNAQANSSGGPFEDLSVFTLGALWDYLDEDSTPISLAVPTVEQNPMIARIEPRKLFVLQTEKVENKDPSVANKETIHTQYKISPAFINQLRDVKVDLVYPFKYVDNPDNYEVEVSASIFLCSSQNPKFFIDRFYPNDDIKKLFESGIEKTGDNVPYVFRVVGSKPLSIASTEKITDPEKAVYSLDISLDNLDTIQNYFSNTPVFETKVTYDVDEDGNRSNPTYDAANTRFNFFPVDASGNVDTSDYSNSGAPADIATRIEREASTKVYPCVAVVVRVKNNDVDAYVDLAPAGWGGDELNGVTGNLGGAAGLFLPPRCPVLPFVGADGFEFNKTFFEANLSGQNAALAPEAVLCKDPRYNHSVEDWVTCTAADEWLDNCEVGNDGDQDNDIFMAVSDQGYLQSVYELAFLPRFDNLPNENKTWEYQKPDNTGLAAYSSQGLNHKLYWRTYKCYNDGKVDDLTNAFQVVSGSTAYKVNPYSQNLNSIMAAFANTPRNWRAASTSTMADGAGLAASAFNKKYTFDALKWEELEELAATFQEDAQQKAIAGQSWEDAWEDLQWDDKSDFLGLGNIEGLHDIDRKFLYGYWRDSFANQQQLFLIFVRAEPTMMGGGAVGATPPALGARAVALVWRDPKAAQAGEPHRMRILFYRQFE